MNVVLLILIGAGLAAIVALSLSAFGRSNDALGDDGPILPFDSNLDQDDGADEG